MTPEQNLLKLKQAVLDGVEQAAKDVADSNLPATEENLLDALLTWNDDVSKHKTALLHSIVKEACEKLEEKK